MAGDRPLIGCRVALAESRELDVLARMMESEGATVVRCPLIEILDAPDQAPVEAWVRRLGAGEFQDVVFYTGEGFRRLLAVAERLGTRDAVLAALANARKMTRGPKPARALKEVGLAPDLPAKAPTTAGMIETFAGETLAGRSIGVQHHAADGNRELIDRLSDAGAKVDVVVPYVYAPASDAEHVARLVDELADGRIDVIAFTSASQIERLLAVARERNAEGRLRAGLARTRVAAVGPVMADALAAEGVRVDIVPEGSFFMKPLVNAVVADRRARANPAGR